MKINGVDYSDEGVTVTARKKIQLLNDAYIIGAREIVRTIHEDLDELYTERDSIDSMISEKKIALEFYNKKIKEWEAQNGA